MILPLLLAMQPASATPATEVFACEYLASEATEPHDPPKADLVVTHALGGSGDGTWTVMWPGKAPIVAELFRAEFGSIGGSVAFRWTETDGKKQTAFISFSDVVIPDGSKAGWLSLGKPSLWQAPGYMCATPPSKSKKDPL